MERYCCRSSLLSILIVTILFIGPLGAQSITAEVVLDSTALPLPPEGGEVNFTVRLVNNGAESQTTTRCLHLTAPNGDTREGATVDNTLHPGQTMEQAKLLSLCAGADSGAYVLIFKWKSDGVWYNTSAEVLKSGSGNGGGSEPDTLSIAYHDSTYESQQGCGAAGLCELAVRFTPDVYPVQLIGLEISQQGDANSAFDLRIYNDPAGTNDGPAAPADAVIQNIGGSPGTYNVAVADEIIIESGDFYVGALELNGYLGISMDLDNQDAFLDRNWASLDGGLTFDWLFNEVNGEPKLYGNFAISATVMTEAGEVLLLAIADPSPPSDIQIHAPQRRSNDGTLSQTGPHLSDRDPNQGTLESYGEYAFVETIPKQTELLVNYPNPFNPQTTINYQLSGSASVNLTIYDIEGKRVKQLVLDDLQSAGLYRLDWNGTNDNGQSVASGIYIYQLRTNEGFAQTRKMMLVR